MSVETQDTVSGQERTRLEPKARVAVLLSGLYNAAEMLCSLFVSVYLWVNSLDFSVVCRYYIALYTVTPIFFVLSGWYAQARDRLHVYRMGLVLHAMFYAVLLLLRERSPDYAVHLGALLGVTWGVFWAGSNTFNFDVTVQGKREYYFGVLQSVVGIFRLIAPPIGGLMIQMAPDKLSGYHLVFGLVIVIYIVCIALSFRMPVDNVRRPFRFKRALFPGRDQRDWRLILLAAVSLAGAFNIFTFLLGLLMYMETDKELSVGVFYSFQAVASIAAAYFVGRNLKPSRWKPVMRMGVFALLLAGGLMFFELTFWTLVLFGLLRAVSGPLVGIPHFSLRLDTIAKSAEEPAQRIEYLCAWEVPLAIGRILMMLTLMGLYGWLTENGLGLRISLFILCAMRIVTYFILTRTDGMNQTEEAA